MSNDNLSATKVREPLVRIAKRTQSSVLLSWTIRLVALVLALVTNALFIYFVTGLDPISVYVTMWQGTFKSQFNFFTTLRDTAMLLCIGIALAPAFKMKFWNIGGEGQFIVGAITATYVALAWGPKLPTAITLILMCVLAMVTAGLYGLLAGFLKVRFGTNETLMTLMLNYVALYILIFISEDKGEWNFFLDLEHLVL